MFAEVFDFVIEAHDAAGDEAGTGVFLLWVEDQGRQTWAS